MNRVSQIVLRLQGVYYFLTGVWPLVSLCTFEMVTGPKVDDWLVQTVGALALIIGLTLLVGARSREPARETMVLAVLAALAFGLVDVVFVLRGVIDKIYLVDAAVQALLLLVLVPAWLRRRDPEYL